MKDSIDTTFDISNLVEFSPKHDSKFEKLKQELASMHSPGLKGFVSHQVVGSCRRFTKFFDNFTVLLTLKRDLTGGGHFHINLYGTCCVSGYHFPA